MEQNKIDINELPADLVEHCRESFESLISVKKGRARAQELYRKGKFIESLKLNKDIDKLFEDDLKKRLSDIDNFRQKVTLKDSNIPKDDVMDIIVKMLTGYMAIDILDSCIVDINDILHRTDKDLKFELFDDLKSLVSPVRAKLSYLAKNTTYLDNAVWGDITDNMYAMMQNKAKAISRKTYEINGENIVKPSNNKK